MFTGSIYKITNKTNDKAYIGQTSRPLEIRWKEHCNSNKSHCSALKEAIKKHGKENFEIILIEECNSIEELNRRELYHIASLGTLAPYGYNLDSGGKNKVLSLETRKKMSEARKGIKHHLFGKKHSEQSKKKMSESAKKRKASDETRKKISDSKKGCKSHLFGSKLSIERKEQMRKVATSNFPNVSEKLKNANEKRKIKVLCNETGILYNSIKEAAIQIGGSSSNIVQNLKGKSLSVKGFTFSYYKG